MSIKMECMFNPPPFACSRGHQPPAELFGETPRRIGEWLRFMANFHGFPHQCKWIDESWFILHQIISNHIISSYQWFCYDFHVARPQSCVTRASLGLMWLPHQLPSKSSTVPTLGPQTIRHQNAHRLVPEKSRPHIMSKTLQKHLASEFSGSTGGSKAKVWGCLMQLLSNSLAILRLTLLNNLTFRRSCSSEKRTKKQVWFQLSRTLGDDQLWSKLSRSQLHFQNHSTTHHFKYTFTSRHENSDVLEMDLSTRPAVLLKLHSKLAHASSPNATF